MIVCLPLTFYTLLYKEGWGWEGCIYCPADGPGLLTSHMLHTLAGSVNGSVLLSNIYVRENISFLTSIVMECCLRYSQLMAHPTAVPAGRVMPLVSQFANRMGMAQVNQLSLPALGITHTQLPFIQYIHSDVLKSRNSAH